MTHSEGMTCLFDRDVCKNGSVGDAWMDVVMISVLASFWRLLVDIVQTVG